MEAQNALTKIKNETQTTSVIVLPLLSQLVNNNKRKCQNSLKKQIY